MIKGFKITAIVVVAVLLVVGVVDGILTADAQDEEISIHYGDTINDQITDEAFQLRYTFDGQEGDVVIIRMISDATDTALATPAFQVVYGDHTLIDSTRVFTLSQTVAYAVFQLPEAGQYSLTATRRDGEAGQDVGGYVLNLYSATPLEADQTISGAGSESSEQYYVIAPNAPFTLSYTKTEGRFSPSITISALREDGAIEQAADMSGVFLDAGTLTVTPDSGVLYLVRVGSGFFNPTRGDVEYRLIYTGNDS